MNSRRGRILALALTIALSLLTSAPVPAQSLGGSGQRIEGTYKILPIPYLNYDRSTGAQFGGIPMVMFNPVAADTLSPSSLAGLMGMYSTKKSWYLVGFGRIHLDQDNWRIMAAGGHGSVNFQFFVDGPIDGWIPYNTEMDFAVLQVQRRIVNHLYGGLSYIHLDFGTTVEPVDAEFETVLDGLGLSLAMDRRSSIFYPRAGHEAKLRYFGYPEAFGNDVNSDKIQLEVNHYLGLRDDTDVLASRLFAGTGLGDLSFNQQFIVGRRMDLRGYTQGEYRGNAMVAVQTEYRWNLRPRFGLVGFAGVATVFDGINAADDGKLLPAVGGGFRYTVDRETHLNVGMDAAAGDGDWGVYFRIGEAF